MRSGKCKLKISNPKIFVFFLWLELKYKNRYDKIEITIRRNSQDGG